jgi:hypothetical protein
MDDGIWNFAMGAIAFLFVVYITAKGELQTYIGLLLYTAPATGAAPTSAQQAGPAANMIPAQENNPVSSTIFKAIQQTGGATSPFGGTLGGLFGAPTQSPPGGWS